MIRKANVQDGYSVDLNNEKKETDYGKKCL